MDGNDSEVLNEEDHFNNNTWLYDDTIARLDLLTTNLLNTTWNDVLFLLTDWQKDQLMEIDSESGVECLLKMWFKHKVNFDTEITAYCNATWDNTNCWPTTAAGIKVVQSCIGRIRGEVTRICLDNGTWSEGYITNQNPCKKQETRPGYFYGLDACFPCLLEEQAHGFTSPDHKSQHDTDANVSMIVGHMVFVGSIVSLLFLDVSLALFYCFKNIWTQRLTLQVHLMLVLVLRFILLCIISEPFVFNRSNTYRNDDIICKFLISAYLYSSLALVMWMLVQGMYLNGKLTTNVMGDETEKKMRFYYFLGWLFPAAVLAAYLLAMMINQHKEMCWKGYPEMIEIWIILVPILVALTLNALFLLNILRVVVYKSHGFNSASETSKLVSIAKATGILFPVLGINNMLLIYNPGGEYEKYFVLLNAFFGSMQGVLVAIVYCFMSKDVQQSIRLSINRFLVQRGFDRMAGSNHRENFSLRSISRRSQRPTLNVSETHEV